MYPAAFKRFEMAAWVTPKDYASSSCALNDIEMLTSEKKEIMNDTFEFLSMPRN